MKIPILYSFRRCPYAMRARLAIAISEQNVQLREIVLKHKPEALLLISPNKTIPVLQINYGGVEQIIDESLDIMVWALSINDPLKWLDGPLIEMLTLIDQNDNEFKNWLDKYKYADRYPEHIESYYREEAEEFLLILEMRLQNNKYLFSNHITLADMAIFPFIRQFSMVEPKWFEQSRYIKVRDWLSQLINNDLFISCMKKYPTWLESDKEFLFPNK